MRLRSENVGDTRAIGVALAGVLDAADVVVLAGDLGTGKTALAQGIAEGLGVEARVTSPSFMIVRVYEDGRLPLHHVDVYRLDHLQELHDLGFEEVVDSRGVTVIEWGDRVVPMLPGDRLDLRLHRTSAEVREIDVTLTGDAWRERARALTGALGRWEEG